MWKVIKVTHYTNFGKESGYTHEGGKTQVYFIRSGEHTQLTLTTKQTRYKKGEFYDLDS